MTVPAVPDPDGELERERQQTSRLPAVTTELGPTAQWLKAQRESLPAFDIAMNERVPVAIREGQGRCYPKQIAYLRHAADDWHTPSTLYWIGRHRCGYYGGMWDSPLSAARVLRRHIARGEC